MQSGQLTTGQGLRLTGVMEYANRCPPAAALAAVGLSTMMASGESSSPALATETVAGLVVLAASATLPADEDIAMLSSKSHVPQTPPSFMSWETAAMPTTLTVTCLDTPSEST